jgi:hypothetical protein
MRDSVIFGVAAAVFVVFTTQFVYTASSSREPIGWAFFNSGIWLALVAASAGTMYAVATGTFPW